MADLNMNTKVPDLSAISGFVRENLVQPLQNSQKTEAKDASNNKIESEKRQDLASEESPAELINTYDPKEMPKEELDETISQLNDSLQNIQRNLEFSIDKDAGRIVINVRDKITDEVVRQIPSEDVLELAKNLHEASERFNERRESDSQPIAEGVLFKTSV